MHVLREIAMEAVMRDFGNFGFSPHFRKASGVTVCDMTQLDMGEDTDILRLVQK
jgi:hypothetical protein